jgi:hypothetical protein
LFSTDKAIGVRLFYCGDSFAFCEHKRADDRTIYAFRTRVNERFYSGSDDEAVQILTNDLRKIQLGSSKLIDPISVADSNIELPCVAETNPLR